MFQKIKWIFLILLSKNFRIETAESANRLLGLATLSAGGFQLLKMTSKKFRNGLKKAGCNSFDGKTLVATEFGLREIQEIQIGEYVWAYNEETGEKSLQEVVHLIRGEGIKELVDIQLASGDVITATAGHPFYVQNMPEDQRWKDAEQLTIDDILQSITNSKLTITNLYEHEEFSTVYNLTVANDHTYYVGRDGVLGHNAGLKECSFEGFIPGAKKPRFTPNAKHTKGGGGKKGSEPASLEPNDSFYSFQKLSIKSSDDGHWYAKSSDGKHIYRYFEDAGTVHFVASTGANPKLRVGNIPIKIRRLFEFNSKGKP